MNYKTKYKPNNNFPVNYLKNHPETPTMNEASDRPPKSSTLKSNFLKVNLPEAHQIVQMIAESFGIIARYSSLGGLIFLTTLKRTITIFANMLTPLLMLLNNFLTVIIGKFDDMSDDFFRFMDYFFLLDDEVLIPIEAEARGSMNLFMKSNRPLVCANSGFAALRTKMQRVSKTATGRIFASDKPISHNSYPGSGNKKPSGLEKRISLSEEKLNTAFPESNDKMKSRWIVAFKTNLKLPLKTIERRLSPLQTLFKFPFTGRVLIFMDSLIMREHAQNRFAHDE